MSIFNFKIVEAKISEEKDWKISYVMKSQKEKVCSHCGAKKVIGDKGTTFNKIFKYPNGEKKFVTYHTCGHKASPCTQAIAQKYNILLP